MKSPKISVVIPSYNKISYIDETLHSIFSQKYDNFEVIVQDGASNDGTLDIIKKYAKKHPKNFFWESKKDKGQLDAINKGLKKAKGDILTFINADDSYLPGAFDKVAEAYTKNPFKLWFAGRGVVVNGSGTEIARVVTNYKNFLLLQSSYQLLLITNYLMQPSVFITQKAYKKFGPFTGTIDFVMEYELWLKLGREEMPVIINKNLTKFRIEATTKTKRMFDKLLKEDERILHRYTKNPVIVFFHFLHNFARTIIGRFV